MNCLLLYLDLEIPKISTNKTNPVEGDSIMLTCSTTAAPSNSFQWIHQGKTVGQTSNLILHNMQQKTKEIYECVVRNSVGIESVTFSLTVQCKYTPVKLRLPTG